MVVFLHLMLIGKDGIENRLGTLIESQEDTSINVLVQFQCFGLLKKDYFGYSINSNRVNGSNLKTELLDACIRQSKWVGLFPDSLDIKIIKRDGRMPTVHYGLKQIKEEDDLNNGIDWDNSDLKNKRRSKTNEKFLLV